MNAEIYYRTLNFKPFLGHRQSLPFALVVERAGKAELRFRGESRAVRGLVDWTYLVRDLARVGVTGIQSWVLDAWQDWLQLTIEDHNQQLRTIFDMIESQCPDLAMTQPEYLDDGRTQNLAEVADDLADRLLTHPVIDRLGFLFGRYEDHPLVELYQDAELVSQSGEAIRFDYVVRSRLDTEEATEDQLTVFQIVSAERGEMQKQVDSAVASFDQAHRIRLPLKNDRAVIMCDSVMVAVPPHVPMIFIHDFEAPARLQELVLDWVYHRH
jgi:hypothetical protein